MSRWCSNQLSYAPVAKSRRSYRDRRARRKRIVCGRRPSTLPHRISGCARVYTRPNHRNDTTADPLPPNDHHSRVRLRPEHRRRPAIHLLLPPRRLHPRPRGRLRGGGIARRQGRHGPDPGELADVRRGPRPICQDTGLVVVFVKVGMEVRWDTDRGVQELVDEGVRRAYTSPGQPPAGLHGARPPIGERSNTGTTPRRWCTWSWCPGTGWR